MKNRMTRLEDLKKCEDGWNGKEAKAMSNEVYEKAKNFIISQTQENFGVFLNEHGEVVVDGFQISKNREIIIEIGNNVWRVYKGDKEEVFHDENVFLRKINDLI